MLQIGAFEAKNTFGNLLDRVEKGEQVLITRHGKPIAQLVQPKPGPNAETTRAAIARMRERAKKWNMGPFDWEGKYKLWRDEGRC